MEAMTINGDAPLCISMGCPAGIGPEITIRALAGYIASENTACMPVVAGDIAVLGRACEATGMPEMRERIREWKQGEPADGKHVNVIPVTSLSPRDVPFGRITEITGRASYEYIMKAVRLCMDGTCSGMVTGPISKEGLKLAGVSFPGHTELLAHETGTNRYAMMLAGSRLRVTLVTIHCALRDVASSLDIRRVLETIRITHESLKDLFGMDNPRAAVAGLNPHAGENGMFGNEEQEIIAPAVEQARAEGMDVTGPLPPDTVFHAAWQGRYDAVVCMYHDQGLIPFKLAHFFDGVNITLALPVIRTSVDHGTAYDIAGTGKAEGASMTAAIDMAAMFVENRTKSRS